MPINSKDGNLYRLRSPNPLAKTQSLWKDEVEKINFKWKTIKADGCDRVNIEEKEVYIEEEVHLEVEEIQEKEVIVKKDKPKIREHLTNITHMYCLPCETSVHTDDLYGDGFKRDSYGAKFVFEAVMIETGDMVMGFWTDCDYVTEKSIVYPFKIQNSKGGYDSLKQYRWWKVTNKETKNSGYLMNCIISDTQPDFS